MRGILTQDTDQATQVRGYLKDGHLVPDDLTCALVVDRLAQPDCASGFILDGFPRSLPQAEMLAQLLEEREERADVAIKIQVPDEEIVARLTSRRMCTQCGGIYNLKFDPPPNSERCPLPECRGELAQRDDDKEETIRERIRVFHDTKDPIVRFYEDSKMLRVVEAGDQNPDDVYAQIAAILSNLQGAAS
jgi:adenylate kinase